MWSACLSEHGHAARYLPHAEEDTRHMVLESPPDKNYNPGITTKSILKRSSPPPIIIQSFSDDLDITGKNIMRDMHSGEGGVGCFIRTT